MTLQRILFRDIYQSQVVITISTDLQSIEVQVEENLEESVELEQLSDAPVDTDKSCDNEESEEPNSCWRKTKFCCSSPIKYCRGMTSVESDDLSDVVTEESCWSKTKKCLCNPIESFSGKTFPKIYQKLSKYTNLN